MRDARRARRRRRALALGSATAILALVALGALFAVSPGLDSAPNCAEASGSRIPKNCAARTPAIVGAPDKFAAEKLLRAAGLNLGVVENRTEADVDAGTVMEQSPAAMSIVKKGRTVNIVVAVGRQNVEVPQLRGLKLPDAEDRLRSAGLVSGSVSGGPQQGTRIVQGQIPAAGLTVKRGTAVDLFLRGQRPPPPPDLTPETLGIDAVGGDIVVTVLVRNLGRGKAPGFTIVAGASRLRSVRQSVRALAAGARVRLDIHMPYPARARGQSIVVFVTVDPDDKVRERNEDNNGDRTAPYP